MPIATLRQIKTVAYDISLTFTTWDYYERVY